MFVVPKHTGGLWPILNLKWFNCYLHIPSFKMPTIRHVWQLIQHGDYALSIDPEDAYLHIPIVKLYHHFYNVFGAICHISVKFNHLGWPQSQEFSQPSLNISCFLAIKTVCVLLSIWMTSWSWFTLSVQVRRLIHFCALNWFALDFLLIFPSLTLPHSYFLFFGVMLGYYPYVSIFASS